MKYCPTASFVGNLRHAEWVQRTREGAQFSRADDQSQERMRMFSFAGECEYEQSGSAAYLPS